MYQSISGAELLERIRVLEHEVASALDDKQRRFRYRIAGGRVRFDEEVARRHAQLRTWLPSYLYHSRLLAVITAPLVYACLVPFVLADLFVSLYHAICFPVYGVPRVRRSDYFVFDRGRLKYLNLLERVNCVYCSYANGLLAYLIRDSRQHRAALVPDQACRAIARTPFQIRQVLRLRRCQRVQRALGGVALRLQGPEGPVKKPAGNSWHSPCLVDRRCLL